MHVCAPQLLINSAGIATWEGLEDVTEKEMMDVFRCNFATCSSPLGCCMPADNVTRISACRL